MVARTFVCGGLFQQPLKSVPSFQEASWRAVATRFNLCNLVLLFPDRQLFEGKARGEQLVLAVDPYLQLLARLVISGDGDKVVLT